MGRGPCLNARAATIVIETKAEGTALLSGLATFSIALAVSTALFGDEPPTGNQGQLGVPVAWIEVPDASDQFYMAQETREGHLYLTANEAFFPSLPDRQHP